MLIEVPKNFLIRNMIISEDFYKNGAIEIDDCLVDEIKDLWSKGIHTLGCCCGHSENVGFIQVERTDFQKMLDLGYKWYHDYPEDYGGKYRFDAFIPKSKCKCEKINNEKNNSEEINNE